MVLALTLGMSMILIVGVMGARAYQTLQLFCISHRTQHLCQYARQVAISRDETVFLQVQDRQLTVYGESEDISVLLEIPPVMRLSMNRSKLGFRSNGNHAYAGSLFLTNELHSKKISIGIGLRRLTLSSM